MTDPSTDSTVPVPIVMSQPDPAPFWDLGVVAAAAAARVRSVNGHGARANARDACRQLAPARQHSLALAWQTDHPSAIPPCRHVRGLHECGLSRRIRGAARYSGRELARVVGMDRRTIDRIRRGQAPRPRLREKLTELAVEIAAVD